MTSEEIFRDMILWWTTIFGFILLFIVCYFLAVLCEKLDPEEKILKKILGKRFYKFLNYFL